jgi:hypothetical protein
MKSFFAIGWRFLLAFALVANPLAAALAAPCHDATASAQAQANADKVPPCHHGTPAGPHGHDCAKAGCDFGACCASCVLVTASSAPLLHPPLHDVGHAVGARALAGPPLPPLIRPPIA